MADSPSTVKGLIFQTHIYRLKELMAKMLDGTISKEERRELVRLHEDCTDMMAHLFADTNYSLEGKELIPEDQARKINALLKKLYDKNVKGLLDE
ncbi:MULTISPECIES: hypothetical protein [Bacillus]|uniref:hypothetical protein n=1 Tax=Bacillus TaxID=1386 RepID=UPI00047D3858|nr:MULTISPECIES: hypothetical protein [Bacillus]QHZ46395.1 hypothetical protein M654_008845 [Bacillus sp. NSP9.1]WFA06535.1 hypothetical protein P3X63_07075 [Bacillus sp. HSf4]